MLPSEKSQLHSLAEDHLSFLRIGAPDSFHLHNGWKSRQPEQTLLFGPCTHWAFVDVTEYVDGLLKKFSHRNPDVTCLIFPGSGAHLLHFLKI